ncbi:MAG: phosphate transport system substrate-binding protein [Bacteroidota bacterium]|nr:phosphate transport system substrate-binding protein [Bacteroidota bacterium]
MKKLLFLIFIITFIACSNIRVGTIIIRIEGSYTMLRLTEALAAEYMKANNSVSIYVRGGGTAVGIKSLAAGSVDICTASRTLKSDEVRQLAENYGTIGISYLIAKDALSIYLNPENPVKNIKLTDLKKIFICKIINWKEIGGNEAPINLIIRPPNSGTHFYFREHVLEGENYCSSALIKESLDGVIEEVSGSINAIGYGGIGSSELVAHVAIDGVIPSEENIINDKYPITRYLYFYTIKNPQGHVRDFIEWTISPEGQKVVKNSGFVPLWNIKY